MSPAAATAGLCFAPNSGTSPVNATFFSCCFTFYGSSIMRIGIVLGIFLGILLTIGGTYAYDTLSGRAARTTSTAASDQRPVVNWDVVSKDFTELHAGLVEMSNRVHEGWRRLTG
jgi:hypothetical protein